MTEFIRDVFTSGDLWYVVVRVLVAFAVLLLIALLLVWFERKLVADMQNRVGPMRAGPFGILQTLADGLKLLFKESPIPRKVELVPYLVAPIIAMVPTFLIFLVIPLGQTEIGGEVVTFRVMDLNVAVLYLLAMS